MQKCSGFLKAQCYLRSILVVSAPISCQPGVLVDCFDLRSRIRKGKPHTKRPLCVCILAQFSGIFLGLQLFRNYYGALSPIKSQNSSSLAVWVIRFLLLPHQSKSCRSTATYILIPNKIALEKPQKQKSPLPPLAHITSLSRRR